LTVEAWRLAYRIPIPRLVSLGGVPCIQTDLEWVEDGTSLAVAGVPIYYLAARIGYQLAGVPRGNFPVLPSAALQVDGSVGVTY
jgi:hypothetical protein